MSAAGGTRVLRVADQRDLLRGVGGDLVGAGADGCGARVAQRLGVRLRVLGLLDEGREGDPGPCGRDGRLELHRHLQRTGHLDAAHLLAGGRGLRRLGREVLDTPGHVLRRQLGATGELHPRTERVDKGGGVRLGHLGREVRGELTGGGDAFQRLRHQRHDGAGRLVVVALGVVEGGGRVGERPIDHGYGLVGRLGGSSGVGAGAGVVVLVVAGTGGGGGECGEHDGGQHQAAPWTQCGGHFFLVSVPWWGVDQPSPGIEARRRRV